MIKKWKLFLESFDIDEDIQYIEDLFTDLKDEGVWNLNTETNIEKWNEDDYSCKIYLTPELEYDFEIHSDINYEAGAKINDTFISYIESVIKYMENEYNYNIIIVNEDLGIELERTYNLSKFLKFKDRLDEEHYSCFGFSDSRIIIIFYEKDI